MSEPHHYVVGDGFWLSLAGAIAGRLMSYAQLVRRGKRRLLGWAFLWEAPTALGMGMIGAGVADHLQLPQTPGLALTTTLAYLGPPALEAAFEMALRRFGGGVSPLPPPDPPSPENPQ